MASGAHGDGDEDCGSCPSSTAMVERLRQRAQQQQQREEQQEQQQPAAAAIEPPPAPEEVGRATWTLLHSMAASYPEHPTPEVQQRTRGWLESLAVVYPCKWCRDDWGRLVALSPPDVGSRAALEQWMCVQHNKVNDKLGKPQFDCTQVRQRWTLGHH